MVHKTKELLTRHRFRVHHISDDIDTHLLICELHCLPDCRLTAARGANDDDTHTLSCSLIELLNLKHLVINVLELLFLDCLGNSRSEISVLDICRDNAWEHISLQRLIRDRIVVGQLRHGVDTDSLDQNECFILVLHLPSLLELLLHQLAASAQDRLESTETPIIMLLFRQQLFTQFEHADDLS